MSSRLRRVLVAAFVTLTLICVAGGIAVGTRAASVTKRATVESSAYNKANAVDVAEKADSSVAITVISDEFSTATQRVTPVPIWPLILERALGVDVLSLSSAGAGYTVQPPGSEFGGTFSALSEGVPSTSKAVIFFGGGNDFRSPRKQLLVNAISAFAEAKTRAPRAQIFVVGPATTSDSPAESLIAVRDTLKEAAATAGVRFVDPIAGRWLSEPSGMLRSDGINLSAKAQEVLEQRMERLVSAAVQ